MRLARIISAALLVCACLVPPASAWMQRSADDGAQRLEVRRGQSAVVETDLAFATIVVADPEIAEAMATSNRSFFLRGKTPGSTTVLVYNSAGAIAELIEIDVKLGLEELRQDIRRLLPGEPIEVYPVHDGVFLDGRVTTAGAAEMALQVAERYVPGGVANGLTVGQSQQVLLEVRFLEASRS
ncbi:MAG: pilus assembly protein N-terminal domain-containing protein, partial [Alphaproteobacteria bacterium]|nr:pilus assembly protein N-terminal domain-containing protein [Alphaproteobacteria bacterium]